MARNEQLVRQHKVLQILERRRFGATLDDLRDSLVEELGLSSLHERSVRRDIEALQAAGFDIGSEETQNGRVWKLRRSDKGLHKLNVSASELIALSMGRDLMVPLLGTQFWQGIEGFWNKVREQLPAGVWEHYEKYRKTLCVSGVFAKSYEKQHGILKTINRAIDEHRVVEMDYFKPGSPLSTRRIEPYGLAMFQSSIYVVALDEGRSEFEDWESGLRRWKLDRFERATALDVYFKANEEVDVQAHVRKSVGIFSGGKTEDYTIRLTEKGARYAQEEPWHDQQKITRQEDGSYLLVAPAYHDMEIIIHALELGEDAEILSPLACRQRIREIVGVLSEKYQND